MEYYVYHIVVRFIVICHFMEEEVMRKMCDSSSTLHNAAASLLGVF